MLPVEGNLPGNIAHSRYSLQHLFRCWIAQAPRQIYHWVVQQKGVAHFIP